jgi:hypothetical protein
VADNLDSSDFSMQDRIAGEVIRQLNPRRVLDASCGGGLLVKALRERGRDAEFSDQAGADPGTRYDLVICIDAPEQIAKASGFLPSILSVTDTLLFAAAPRESGEAGLDIGREPMRWIMEFAAHGFAPDIAFDGRFASPRALLLRRQAPLASEVAQLFAECLDRRDLASRGEAVDHVETAGLELRNYKERAASLEQQVAREHEYLETLRGVQAYLTQEVQRLRANAPGTSPAAGVFDTEAVVARIRSEMGLPPNASAGETDVSWLLQQYSELRAVIIRLDRRSAVIERSVQGVALQVSSVLESRIWKTLVKLSGILLGMTRSGQKRSP